MSIVRFSLLEGRNGKIALSGTKIVRTYFQRYIAVTDDQSNDEALIEAYINANPGTPKFLSSHPNFLFALLTDRTIAQQDKGQDGRIWHIDCNYTTDIPPVSPTENPLDMPAKVEYRSQKRKRVIWVDLDGKPCVNTAYQLFDPPLEIDETGAIVTITRNESSFGFASHILPMENHTNASSIWGAAAETLLIQEVTGQNAWHEGAQYWVVKYVIEYNERGWKESILSRGMMQIESAGKLTRCKDANKQDVTEPVPLDTNGKQIPASSLPGAAYFKEFRTKNTYDFSLLNISL